MYITFSIIFVAAVTISYIVHLFRMLHWRHTNEMWNAHIDVWDKERIIREQEDMIDTLKRKLHDANN